MAVNLKAILGFDGKAYEAGMKKATALSKKASNNIGSNLKGAIMGTMTAGFLAAKAKEVGEFARELNDLAPALGTTTDELQKWEYVFARFGLELADTSDAFATLADRAEDALSGTESMIEDFRLIGVSVDQLRGKSPEQLFELFADGVAKTTDRNRALTAIVRNLGDDLGRKLAPALMLGSKGLREMRQEAEDLGIIMDGKSIQEISDKVVEMQIASMRLRGVWGQITAIFGQVFTFLSDGARFLNPWSKMMAAAGTFVGTVESGGGFIKAGLESVKTVFNEYMGVIDEVGKREDALDKRRNQKSAPATRSTQGINDELEAKKAQEALQKKINDHQFKQMTKEQQLNSLFSQRLALFEKIRKATGKKKFELMSQDFDLFSQMQGIHGDKSTATKSNRAMTQTASQNVGAFSRRVNPMVQVGREQIGIMRQSLNVQQQILARSNRAGLSPSPY